MPACAGMTVRVDAGLRRHDEQCGHSGMGLAGIQKSFNKLDAGLRRHDSEGGCRPAPA